MEILKLLETIDLWNIFFRENTSTCNPNIMRYTVKRKGLITQAILDLFLILKSLSNRVRDIEYRNRYSSNHSLFFLEFKIIEKR